MWFVSVRRRRGGKRLRWRVSRRWAGCSGDCGRRGKGRGEYGQLFHVHEFSLNVSKVYIEVLVVQLCRLKRFAVHFSVVNNYTCKRNIYTKQQQVQMIISLCDCSSQSSTQTHVMRLQKVKSPTMGSIA